MSKIKKVKLFFSSFTNRDISNQKLSEDKEFTDACNLLRLKREKYNFTRKELSKKTKISVVVIEAIEKGWVNQLPERTFLKKMLISLESELNLEKGSLLEILNRSEPTKLTPARNKISPINIGIFRNWYGNILYFVLIITSILLMNNQENTIYESDKLYEVNPNIIINEIYIEKKK